MSERPRFLPPAYFLASIVLAFLLHAFVPLRRLVPGPWNLAGALLMAGGLAMNVWASGHFERLNTTIKPFGDPSELTTQGLYRFTRNPMYLGGIILLMGLAVLLGSLSPWIVIPPFWWVIDRRFIRIEEEILERRFGADYAEYCRRVSRWI